MTAVLANPATIYYGEPVRIGAPTALPVSLAELKAHCRIDLDEDDALLMGYLRAAVEWVESYTGLALISSTWQQTASAFPTASIRYPNAAIELSRRPVQAITAIDYLDAGGVAAVLDPSIYVLAGVGGNRRSARITLGTGQAWPAIYTHSEAVTVTYIAGFGDTHNEVPELIRHALMLLVSTWYDYRGDLEQGPAVNEVPLASKALLAEWRAFGVA